MKYKFLKCIFFFWIKIYIFNHFFSISVDKTILFVYLSINCYKENNLLVSILFMHSQYLAIMVNMLTSIDFFFYWLIFILFKDKATYIKIQNKYMYHVYRQTPKFYNYFIMKCQKYVWEPIKVWNVNESRVCHASLIVAQFHLQFDWIFIACT